MSFLKKIARSVFYKIPASNETIYRLCERYVDRFNFENNSNPDTNGENRLIRNLLSGGSGWTVFDVGANVGNWANYALQVESTIDLHCFEPSSGAFKKLASRNWPTNVTLNNLGAGDVAGKLELNIVNSSSGLNSVYVRRGAESARAETSETIVIETIDQYCDKRQIDRIELFKVDVEGHELAVFKGMKRILAEGRVGLIQFEYGGCNLDARVHLADIWEYLNSFGFKFYKIHPGGVRRVPAYDQRLETFKYSNWLAVHRTVDARSFE